MRASRAGQGIGRGFAGSHEAAENVGNPEKWHKNLKKWQKTCGNRAFAVDKVCEKTQGKRR
jgi:hypothetical protein